MGSEKSLEIRQDQIEKEKQAEQQRIEEATKNKEILEKVMIIFKAKAGKDGRMFGNISTKQIAEEIIKLTKVNVDKRKITSEVLINSFGVTVVNVELHKKVIAKVKVQVLPIE